MPPVRRPAAPGQDEAVSPATDDSARLGQDYLLLVFPRMVRDRAASWWVEGAITAPEEPRP